ncbi:hypothetical protein A2V61_01130 [Candidatus Woesebacteria bacterium RBG_19FT_COMBO_47_8]|uniref:Beta-lactamase class A catalytic domain-containing protein n=1 Tax=Candidatus Woesebacteria bacterium RBG_13_46_13 TaxID=1802479 RepID=A0A1F7X5Z7_9BACT|nr:MAG: hypothetical protein A2Y68_01595 [Candidatus Woesebacteria bacterium RBG_13_46_13]OGM17992.1 MAG: hypothetical protein A2V61_01130 [Candidatus Woesebacteria bacterium RBG_19FT_COMBO_47_8]HJX59277.1 serine hydrolase [Patescibacteria group bacterium]
MSIFSKRQDDYQEDEFDEDEESFSGKGRRNLRRIKDLKPENRRKRKEPPKPWGKKERYLVLGFLLGSVILSLTLAASARSWKLPGFPKISWPSFKEEVIIITANKSEKEKAEKTVTAFEGKTDEFSGIYAFEVLRLGDGFSYGVSQDKIMQAASLIKLPILATLYSQAEAGKIDLDAKYTLKASDKIAGAGSLAAKPAGTVITYRQMAELMGKQSDNTAFGIVKRTLGDGAINQEIAKIGMVDTSLAENETTPADIALFFQKLWNKEIVTEDSRDEILNYLTDTIYNDWLVKGIPQVRVAHKYGREVHVINDAGIVFSDKPFVLVIMTKGIIEKEADTLFPELARLIYEAEIR